MEVQINYSQTELDKAVEFISKHNPTFYGQDDTIRATILDCMKEVALNPKSWIMGTMGFMLIGDREDEGIDSDNNIIHYEILVNPAMGKERNFINYTVSDDETFEINSISEVTNE